MTVRLHQRAIFLVLAVAGGMMISCQQEKSDARKQGEEPPSPNQQGVANFFSPQPGETWTYRVRREIPLGASLSAADRARRPVRTDTGQVVTFERSRTCAGVEQPDGSEKPLTVIDIHEDDEHRGRELYDINPEGVFSRGWLGADGGASSDVLAEGVAIALRNLQAGLSWEDRGRDKTRRFDFRVIERVELQLPAGKFETARIQITSSGENGTSLKRTIWFAENVGIVKEETVKYGPQRVIGREWAELVDWTLPDQAQAKTETP